jgi:3-deoxy-D-manno-octulosonic-acid transferase
VVQFVVMALYSLLLMAVLVVGAPYWLTRMYLSAKGRGRYWAGLAARLGRVPAALRTAVAGRQVVWVHAVSVGEVLAATRLVAELEAALGEGWAIVVSTTTATGQALARERFGAGSEAEGSGRVFYYPLDFAWAVRAYLRALQPRLLVLMESELWPRMLVECGRAGVPVAVVNARVSDRSFARGVKVRAIWGSVLRMVTVFLVQTEEDRSRLVRMGAREPAVRVIGNLKYDVRAPKASRLAELIKQAAAGRPIIVAGSTVDRTQKKEMTEEELVIRAWEGELRNRVGALLVLAPRHPERFGLAESLVMEFGYVKASEWAELPEGAPVKVHRAEKPVALAEEGQNMVHEPLHLAAVDSPHVVAVDVDARDERQGRIEVVLLDTIGDLAAVYQVADVAFVGGSLVQRGGHNPLEPAQFGVPVVMGPSFENFRGVVGNMVEAYAIRIVEDSDGLELALFELLTDREAANLMGKRGRLVFAGQQGATARAVTALLGLVGR